MTPERPDKLPEYAVSDEAAAYIADALMELALQFESVHWPDTPPPPIHRPKERRRSPRSVRQTPPFKDQVDAARLPFLSFLPAFFCSARAASILPSRPRNSAAAAHRACQGWTRLRGHPKGLALTGPSTAASSTAHRGSRSAKTPAEGGQITSESIPLEFSEVHAAGNTRQRTPFTGRVSGSLASTGSRSTAIECRAAAEPAERRASSTPGSSPRPPASRRRC